MPMPARSQERKNHKGVLSPNDQSPFENRCRPGQPSASRRCYAIAHEPAALVSVSPRIRERHGRVAAEGHALSFATSASRFEMPCNQAGTTIIHFAASPTTDVRKSRSALRDCSAAA
jgi:hypothetical protein